ncbi:helix-turn-helix domain-containing protein [Streptomyces sp. NPDC059832]|uniref:helix-turn-helix domain-containing protein n=1 Tax=Streptomyces sp. NPDC059832 TaxID=3346966 RepID=UPI003648880C
MRYAEGGGLTAERRAFREQVRLEAGRRFAAGEKTAVIAKELRVSERSVERRHRARREGGPQALRSAGPGSGRTVTPGTSTPSLPRALPTSWTASPPTSQGVTPGHELSRRAVDCGWARHVGRVAGCRARECCRAPAAYGSAHTAPGGQRPKARSPQERSLTPQLKAPVDNIRRTGPTRAAAEKAMRLFTAWEAIRYDVLG